MGCQSNQTLTRCGYRKARTETDEKKKAASKKGKQFVPNTEAAKKAGKYRGRKTVIDSRLIAKVKDLKENKNLSVTEIAKVTEKSRATIYRVLKEHLGFISNRLVKSSNGEETNAGN